MFYMVICMAKKWFATEFDSENPENIENMMGHVNNGNFVVIVDDLDTVSGYVDVTREEIEIVE